MPLMPATSLENEHVTAAKTKCLDEISTDILEGAQIYWMRLTFLSVKIDNSSIERVEEFKYLGTRLTDQNSIQEEIKSRLKLGNACYHSVQKCCLTGCYPKT
jgi:hypothetical protein